MELLVEQIAWQLTQGKPKTVAFLIHRETVFYSFGQKDIFPCDQPVVQLIQAVYDLFPTLARIVLRNRIFSTGSSFGAARGMVKVAAKRISDSILPRNHQIQLTLRFVEVQNQRNFQNDIAPPQLAPMDQAVFLASQVIRDQPRYLCDRAVAAVLIAETGQVIGTGLNTNQINKTLHAEINLIQRYYFETRQRFPVASKLYVTLKPCRMCAEMILEMVPANSEFQVYYLEDDLGTHARSTCLDLRSDIQRRY